MVRMSRERREEIESARDQGPEEGVAWYVQAHCLDGAGVLTAGPPRYFDLESMARHDFMHREREWPEGATGRVIDLCRRYWSLIEGERHYAPAKIIEQRILDGYVPGVDPGVYGLHPEQLVLPPKT